MQRPSNLALAFTQSVRRELRRFGVHTVRVPSRPKHDRGNVAATAYAALETLPLVRPCHVAFPDRVA
jgi:hypothetical protein